MVSSVRQTRWVGIVNATPDSFSNTPNMMPAVEQSVALMTHGAHVVDLGAESTRPGATPIAWEEEWHRLQPILSSVKERLAGKAKLSIDTRHAEVATRALAAGVDWINDVSGFSDSDMIAAVRASDCTLVAMHSLDVPANPKNTLPVDADPVEAVLQWANEKITALGTAGIARERIIMDPGIGFGKNARHSMELIDRIGELHALKTKLMVGHSRKSFLTLLASASPEERDGATIQVSKKLFGKVDYLRVHDVAGHVAAFANMKHAV